MRRRTFPLAAGLLAFVFGASLDYQLRRPGRIPDCFRMYAKRRPALHLDHPLTSLSRPLATYESLRTPRRLG